MGIVNLPFDFHSLNLYSAYMTEEKRKKKSYKDMAGEPCTGSVRRRKQWASGILWRVYINRDLLNQVKLILNSDDKYIGVSVSQLILHFYSRIISGSIPYKLKTGNRKRPGATKDYRYKLITENCKQFEICVPDAERHLYQEIIDLVADKCTVRYFTETLLRAFVDGKIDLAEDFYGTLEIMGEARDRNLPNDDDDMEIKL